MRLKDDDKVVGTTKIMNEQEEEKAIEQGEQQKEEIKEAMEDKLEQENVDLVKDMDFVDKDEE